MMRQSALLLSRGAIVLALAAISPGVQAGTPAPLRYQNFHGAACQTNDPTLPHGYSEAGIAIPPTAGTTALMCPVTWSLDAPTYPLQEIYLSVTWSSAPTTGTPFNPSCTFLMNTNASVSGGLFIVPYMTTINPGTSTPTIIYHWRWDPTIMPALIFYQNVVGSVLSCSAVPPGVVLNGYSVTSCVSTSLGNC
jgi:hypothetical protein